MNLGKCDLRFYEFFFQTRHQIEKLLDWENSHLYNKLGLKWRLARQRCDSTLMMEYVRDTDMLPVPFDNGMIVNFRFS